MIFFTFSWCCYSQFSPYCSCTHFIQHFSAYHKSICQNHFPFLRSCLEVSSYVNLNLVLYTMTMSILIPTRLKSMWSYIILFTITQTHLNSKIIVLEIWNKIWTLSKNKQKKSIFSSELLFYQIHESIKIFFPHKPLYQFLCNLNTSKYHYYLTLRIIFLIMMYEHKISHFG